MKMIMHNFRFLAATVKIKIGNGCILLFASKRRWLLQSFLSNSFLICTVIHVASSFEQLTGAVPSEDNIYLGDWRVVNNAIVIIYYLHNPRILTETYFIDIDGVLGRFCCIDRQKYLRFTII